jgi:hypothetical protein
MGARAAELVRQEFSLDLTVARYIAAYNELLDRPVQSKLQAPKANPNGGSLGQKRFS